MTHLGSSQALMRIHMEHLCDDVLIKKRERERGCSQEEFTFKKKQKWKERRTADKTNLTFAASDTKSQFPPVMMNFPLPI